MTDPREPPGPPRRTRDTLVPSPLDELRETADPGVDAVALQPPEDALPSPDAEGTLDPPVWAQRPDPMAAAEAALQRAREARGVKDLPDPVVPRDRDLVPRAAVDPFAAAEAALARAREARGLPGDEGARMPRDTDRALRAAKAEAELRRLKRELAAAEEPDEDG